MSTPQVRLGPTPTAPAPANAVKFEARHLDFYYGKVHALKDVNLTLADRQITAFIGPSGCGKSTLLRVFNRMYALYPGHRATGDVRLDGEDILAASVDVAALRFRVGMVFQKATPFPMSIFDNVAFGLRLNRYKGKMGDRVEQALTRAALWDEVKDKLKNNGLSLSGGQQQRLCIARAIATEPSVLLMDEPCSALDPIATRRVEELMLHLKQNYTIAIVTHNMQQATRVADTTAFFSVDMSKGGRTGYLVEMGPTKEVFENPQQKLTKDYISGQFS